MAHRPTPHYGDALTVVEKRILTLVANGVKLNKEIGQDIHFSEAWVKSALYSIRTKLGAKNTTNAVALAMRSGLIQ